VRPPAKTAPDGHRTAPLVQGGSKSTPPPSRFAPVLVVLGGPQVGERVALPPRLEVGRDARAGLRLLEAGVGAFHVRIQATPRLDRWELLDLGAGPTLLNGSPLPARTAQIVGPQDEIRIGGTTLRIELHDEVEQEFDRVVVERLQRDDLTGLLSRRRFEHELASVLELGDEAGPVALVLLDVDGLKRVNDTHGHLAGAAVIAHVGRTLGAVVGARGAAARLGGDELAVVLMAPREQVVALVRGALAAIRSTPCEHEGLRLAVTASAGIGWRASSPEVLYHAADAALLEAKRAGGDRMVLEP
jgi:diguanylate cyclase (GGDEF)-like protein